jgi:peptide/nickel transport system substrate-binding protein
VATIAEPRSLLPPYAPDIVAGMMADLLYQRLADPTPGFSTLGDRDFRPALAKDWSWSPDSTRLRFELDSAARWHDGREVTSRDVVFTFALLRDSTAGTLRPPLDPLIDSVTAAGPHRVDVWVRRWSPSLFHAITYPVHVLPAHRLAAVPRAALTAHPSNRAPVGSGAFQFVRWSPGERVELRRAEATRTTGPSRVVLRIFPDYSAALNAALVGEIDVFDFPQAEHLPQLRARSDLRELRLPALTYGALQFNLRPAPASSRVGRAHDHVVSDWRVRRAIAHALDRHALVANLFGAEGRVASGPFTHAQATTATSVAGSVAGPAYDPARAARLLDQAGWRVVRGTADGVRRWGGTPDGAPLHVALLVPTSSAVRRRAAVIIQAALRTVGIETSVEALDNAAMIERLRRGAFDAALMAFRVDPDPGGLADTWGSAAAVAGGFNFGGYASRRVDSLIELASREGEPARARQRYAQAYQQIVDDVPAVFLYEPVAVVVHRRRWSPVGARADAWWGGLARWTRLP